MHASLKLSHGVKTELLRSDGGLHRFIRRFFCSSFL